MTLIERVILESIQLGARSIPAIAVSTDINKKVVANAVSELLDKGLINHLNGKLELNKLEIYNLSKNYNFQKQKRNEVRNLIDSCIKNYFFQESSIKLVDEDNKKSNLSLKKVWMSEKDEKIFNGMIYNLNSFLDEISKKSSKDLRLIKNKKVIFFGNCNYNQIIEEQYKIPAS